MSGVLQADTPPLVLASTSATRIGLLRAAGLSFETVAPAVDEAAIRESARADGLDPSDCALLLAELKARRISERWPAALVIGADQLLVCGERWFDKPDGRTAAREQLRALAGQRHTLVAAVVCLRGGVRVWQHVATPCLAMRAIGDAAIEAYLDAAGAAVTLSVGAYQVEGLGIRLFSAIEGEHAAILGLPLLPLLGFLRQHGVLRD